jgi:hypothetical protein
MEADKSLRTPADQGALVSEEARSATEWIGVGADYRGGVLRELLGLADALRPSPERGLGLADKVSAIHRAFGEAGIPHAFGGALAVAYYGEPRSTLDIDVNVFVAADRWSSLYDALGPLDVDLEIDEKDLARSHEARLDWNPNSLHLFFSYDGLHQQMNEDIREVPFNNGPIPIVSPEHLVIRKALLDRTKDWLDIEQILVATSPLDLQEIERWVKQMTGVDDPRLAKLRSCRARLAS